MKNPKYSFTSYLKEKNIQYIEDMYEGISRITMLFSGYSNSPSRCIEGCIYFRSDVSALEARVYYAEPGPQITKEQSERFLVFS